MSFADEWAADEDSLTREASSLGELLARMKGLISPSLLGGREWERLVASAHELPPTLAGFPLWLGMPIDASPPAAFLGVSVPGGTRAAAFFETVARAGGADPSTPGAAARAGGADPSKPGAAARTGGADLSTSGAASLLRETGMGGSPLRRIAGDRVLLHHEIGSTPTAGARSGFFLYPIRPTLPGDGSAARLRDFGVALDAVASAAGRMPDAAVRRRAERAYLALEPDTRVGAIGNFPSQDGGLRLMMLGFTGAADVIAFLQRAGWPERRSKASSALARLDECGAFAGMTLGVEFNVSATGIGPEIKVQVFSGNTIYDRTGWFKEKDFWKEHIDILRAESLATPGKLTELAKWSSGARMLVGRSGTFLLLQRIHHFAITLTGSGIEQVSAYVFMLMCRWPGRPAA